MIAMQPLADQHARRYGDPAGAFQAPGRVNLIGEHTDYTGGLVMPAAIDFQTVALVTPADGASSVIYSANFDEEFRFESGAPPEKPRHHWSDYPLGVLWSLRQSGVATPPFSMTLCGNVPLGAGLSSSASIEVAVALAALSLAQATMPLTEIAVVCRRAENGYVGAQSGIMDQYIACHGVAGHALLIDTRDLTSRAVPLPPDVRLVICNSMVKHSHAGGEYNQRRAEVEEGSRAIYKADPQIEELRDATLADLEGVRGSISEQAFRRCRHIITENTRVQDAAAALEAGDMARVGRLMAEAHASYRDDFEASCPEADLLVQLAGEQPGMIGARLTGGGFGGCTVNLVRAEQAEPFRRAMHQGYLQRTGIDAEIYLSSASAGAAAVQLPR